LERLNGIIRHPFSSRKARRQVRSFITSLDISGLKPAAANASRDYAERGWPADMAILLLHLNDAKFRQRALSIEDRAALDDALAQGRGAIVAGVHLGPHAALPLTLAQLGYEVAVVGDERILNTGRKLAGACLLEAASRLSWLPVGDASSLMRARATLRRNAIVVAFIEQFVEAPRNAAVTLFGRRVTASAMLPYLASLARSPIVPASMISDRGPAFSLRFEPAFAAPERNDQAIGETMTNLFQVVERRALERPEQWLLWQQFASATSAVETTAQAATRRLAVELS
jgi:lauroyl/myristoyl acyltransferase